ncbi:MAG TPA: hypothetical protein VNU26_05070 [Mycobacteriales bacterium]|nr:hypothetical protein [Mycobacteriales bacterium]
MRTRPLAALVVTATAAALTSSALAAPSALTIDSAMRSGSVVTAAGTAAFTGVDGPTAVGGTETPFPNADVAKAYGIDLVGASIEPLADGSGLRFVWQLSSMPAVTPPEGVRYTWSFGVGDKTFQLQAKRTNVASTTTPEDPAGHAGALAGGFFQLRGNCGSTYLDTVPLANCPHLAFLSGGFDTAAGRVHMDVPYGLEVAKEIAPGAVITEVQTATMSISAAPQAVASTATAAEFINGWDPYYAPGGNVSVAVGTDKTNPATVAYRPATFADGSWTATVDRVPSTATMLFARACEGGPSSCVYTSVPLG